MSKPPKPACYSAETREEPNLNLRLLVKKLDACLSVHERAGLLCAQKQIQNILSKQEKSSQKQQPSPNFSCASSKRGLEVTQAIEAEMAAPQTLLLGAGWHGGDTDFLHAGICRSAPRRRQGESEGNRVISVSFFES